MKKLTMLIIVLSLVFSITIEASGAIQSYSDSVTYSSNEPGWFLVTPVEPKLNGSFSYVKNVFETTSDPLILEFQYFENYQSFVEYQFDFNSAINAFKGSFRDKIGFFLGTDYNFDPTRGEITRHYIYPGYCLSFNKWGYISVSADMNLTPGESTFGIPAVDCFTGLKVDSKIFLSSLSIKNQIRLNFGRARNFNLALFQESGLNYKPFKNFGLYFGLGMQQYDLYLAGYYYGVTLMNQYFTIDGAYGEKLNNLNSTTDEIITGTNYYEADAMLTPIPYIGLGGKYYTNLDTGDSQFTGQARLKFGKFKTTFEYSTQDFDCFFKVGCQIDL